jgi:hypothetical protein
MTEAEWLACESWLDILKLFPAHTSPRKLRLFAVACCRALPGLAESSVQALDVAERHADGQVDLNVLRQAYREAFGLAARHDSR